MRRWTEAANCLVGPDSVELIAAPRSVALPLLIMSAIFLRKAAASSGSRFPMVEPGKSNNRAVCKAAAPRQLERLEVICADRQNFEGGKFFAKSNRGLGKLFARDIYWQIVRPAPRDYPTGFASSVPAPVPRPINSIPGPECLGDLAAALAQNPHLRARDVILREARSFSEKSAEPVSS